MAQKIEYKLWKVVENFYKASLAFHQLHDVYEKKVLEYSKERNLPREELKLNPTDLAGLIESQCRHHGDSSLPKILRPRQHPQPIWISRDQVSSYDLVSRRIHQIPIVDELRVIQVETIYRPLSPARFLRIPGHKDQQRKHARFMEGRRHKRTDILQLKDAQLLHAFANSGHANTEEEIPFPILSLGRLEESLRLSRDRWISHRDQSADDLFWLLTHGQCTRFFLHPQLPVRQLLFILLQGGQLPG